LIERIAKVIHWFGFLCFISFYFYCVFLLLVFIGGSETAKENFFDQYEVLGFSLIGIIPFILSWILRYILTGSLVILPTSKSEQGKFFNYIFLATLGFVYLIYFIKEFSY